MIPIYFPFTYVHESIAQAISRIFPAFSIYQPTQTDIPEEISGLAANKTISIRIPTDQDDAQIKSLCNEYMEWRGVHETVDMSILKKLNQSALDKAENTLYQIKSDIKKGDINRSAHDRKKAEKPINTLFNARIFLQLAQNYDRNQVSIEKELKQIKAQENKLLENLKGETNGLFDNLSAPLATGTPGEYMPYERIMAWSRLFLHDMKSVDRSQTPLFVTHSRFMLETVIDKYPKTVKAVEIKGISHLTTDPTDAIMTWTKNLNDFIDLLTTATASQSLENNALSDVPGSQQEDTGCLTIYKVPDYHPTRFFTGFLDSEDYKITAGDQRTANGPVKHTVIALIEYEK